MNPIILSLLAGALVLCACTDSGANYTPILDGPPSATYDADLLACQTLARNQKHFDQETAGAAVIGAGAGALLGELDNDTNALEGAIAGAMAGGVAGAVNANDRRRAIVLECLRGRGHAVVG